MNLLCRRVAVFQGMMLALSLLLTTIHGTAARPSPPPPAAFPRTPDPTACTVAPREPATLATLVVASGAAATPAAQAAPPTAVTIPLGRPADAADVASVDAVVEAFVACANAGDVDRMLALFSDAYLRRAAAVSGGRLLLPPPSTPRPAKLRTTILAITDVSVLTDGRLGAFVVVDARGLARPDTIFVVLVQEDDRWRIDDIEGFLPGGPTDPPA